MYETMVTMVGWVAGDVTQRRTSDDATWARFRMVSTERRYDADKMDWVDGNVMFVSVHCWRKVGVNALAAIKSGDPVFVHGRMRIYGQDKRDVQIDAHSLGLDLSRCQDVVRSSPDERPALASVA